MGKKTVGRITNSSSLQTSVKMLNFPQNINIQTENYTELPPVILSDWQKSRTLTIHSIHEERGTCIRSQWEYEMVRPLFGKVIKCM